MAIVDIEHVSKTQPMREGEIAAVDTLNNILSAFPLTGNDIGAHAIKNINIADGAVTSSTIANSAVTSDKIQDSAVTNAKLGSSAVTSDKIQDSAVTNAKLGSSAVTSDKIQDSAVTNAKLDASLQNAIKILSNIPSMEYGISDEFNIEANGYTDTTISLASTVVEAPVVFCTLKSANDDSLNAVLTLVTTSDFTIRVYNPNNSQVVGVTFDWFAVYGR